MREEEKKRSSQNSGTQRKKWIFPAVYISAAALLLTAVVWITSGDDEAQKPNETGTVVNENGDIVEVNNLLENFVWPVENPDEVKVVTGYWDSAASNEEQEAALVFYNNQYRPNKGIDIAMENGESFNVVASMAGVVSDIREDSLLGNVIEVKHAEGVVTQYQSVTDIQVEVGDQVEQGQVLASAGQSLLNEAAGTHLHFEVRVDGQAVNPLTAFDNPLSALVEMNTEATADEEADANEPAVEDPAAEEPATEDPAAEEPADEGQVDDETESDEETSDEPADETGDNEEESPDASIGQDNA
ncbi:stage II sporulation protein Q [Bacillus oleivorans]|uniref:Stage II sporulation protein Q n=1 Tax=Bacillus oleivorans TaxID=1448271 RepID=A0A285CHD4_9BACI|nr:M23 family metallopeptidase [Bacillus oleivorans]SNX67001.1 stage II sporulation protein Q [Bacillus oleivorans]